MFMSRFGPRESKKAMAYSGTGRLNCSVSYTTFATPTRGQVYLTSTLMNFVVTFCLKFILIYI